MKKYIWIPLIILSAALLGPVYSQSPMKDGWQASWITSGNSDTVNTWTVFRKSLDLANKPKNELMAKIAVDSKYWLWINEELVVLEGQLKRGPTPEDTYYDEINIGPYLKSGKNTIAVLVWYFGKHGFTHKSSGKSGLIFDSRDEDLNILSNNSWKAWKHPSFGFTDEPHPNYRLPESNIRFDARKGDFDFINEDFDDSSYPKAIEVGIPPVEPWNNLVERPIPLWKNFGLKNYVNTPSLPFVSDGDTLAVTLPYNAQIHPYLKVEAEAGHLIDIRTDHYYGGGTTSVRCEYITKNGVQEYENLGWMNGHQVQYIIPKGIKVLDLKYRETGYDTEMSGSFKCDDDFFNRLWTKAERTLYINMRDNYFDCPDRERAQWWGDVILEMEESFYAQSVSSHALARKGILELMNWQREDKTIFSPVPAGNWGDELPGQMLASVGYYGFWSYYMHTGDSSTLAQVYPRVKDYLSIWKINDQGTVVLRNGGWLLGDWGDNIDMEVLINGWYYLALKGFKNMSVLLGKVAETTETERQMKLFKKAFNEAFWQGSYYRSTNYAGKTDDRGQSLAVVSGLAEQDKYPHIRSLFKQELHASPYMEKYVLESLYIMGYPKDALIRMEKRFGKMVNHPVYTTLWEGWGIGPEGFGGGTINHGWSGGGLTLLSQKAAGIFPIAPGYSKFRIKPQPGFLKQIEAKVQSVSGEISVQIEIDAQYKLVFEVPEKSIAKVYIPARYKRVELNDEGLVKNGSITSGKMVKEDDYYVLSVSGGNYTVTAN